MDADQLLFFHMIHHEQKLSNPFRQGTHATITGAVEKAVFETSHPQDEGSKKQGMS